jgi:hypothetical protein
MSATCLHLLSTPARNRFFPSQKHKENITKTTRATNTWSLRMDHSIDTSKITCSLGLQTKLGNNTEWWCHKRIRTISKQQHQHNLFNKFRQVCLVTKDRISNQVNQILPNFRILAGDRERSNRTDNYLRLLWQEILITSWTRRKESHLHLQSHLLTLARFLFNRCLYNLLIWLFMENFKIRLHSLILLPRSNRFLYLNLVIKFNIDLRNLKIRYHRRQIINCFLSMILEVKWTSGRQIKMRDQIQFNRFRVIIDFNLHPKFNNNLSTKTINLFSNNQIIHRSALECPYSPCLSWITSSSNARHNRRYMSLIRTLVLNNNIIRVWFRTWAISTAHLCPKNQP